MTRRASSSVAGRWANNAFQAFLGKKLFMNGLSIRQSANRSRLISFSESV